MCAGTTYAATVDVSDDHPELLAVEIVGYGATITKTGQKTFSFLPIMSGGPFIFAVVASDECSVATKQLRIDEMREWTAIGGHVTYDADAEFALASDAATTLPTLGWVEQEDGNASVYVVRLDPGSDTWTLVGSSAAYTGGEAIAGLALASSIDTTYAVFRTWGANPSVHVRAPSGGHWADVGAPIANSSPVAPGLALYGGMPLLLMLDDTTGVPLTYLWNGGTWQPVPMLVSSGAVSEFALAGDEAGLAYLAVLTETGHLIKTYGLSVQTPDSYAWEELAPSFDPSASAHGLSLVATLMTNISISYLGDLGRPHVLSLNDNSWTELDPAFFADVHASDALLVSEQFGSSLNLVYRDAQAGASGRLTHVAHCYPYTGSDAWAAVDGTYRSASTATYEGKIAAVVVSDIPYVAFEDGARVNALTVARSCEE